MNINQYKYKALQNKPECPTIVFAVQKERSPLTKGKLATKFPGDFGESVRQLADDYQIRLDETVSTAQHAPRRVAVALRPRLEEVLEED